MKHLGAVTDRLVQAAGTDRQDHELLQINAVVGMRATVNDVHHGHRHDVWAVTTQHAVQPHALLARSGLRRCQRHGQ